MDEIETELIRRVRREAATPEGRRRLAAALRRTLAEVEGAAGARRARRVALDELAFHLAMARDHLDFLRAPAFMRRELH